MVAWAASLAGVLLALVLLGVEVWVVAILSLAWVVSREVIAVSVPAQQGSQREARASEFEEMPADRTRRGQLRRWRASSGTAPNVGDGNILMAYGIPTVQYGAGDIRIYKEWPTPDERVPLKDLVTAARAIGRPAPTCFVAASPARCARAEY